jgi:hypothetical protein
MRTEFVGPKLLIIFFVEFFFFGAPIPMAQEASVRL